MSTTGHEARGGESMSIIKFGDLENRLIRYKDEYVLVDSDIAQLYGVETRDINKGRL